MTTDRDQATRDRLAEARESIRRVLHREACAFLPEGDVTCDDLADALLPVVADLVREGQAGAVAKVRELHFSLLEDLDSDPRCHEDGDRWPCDTEKALRAFAGEGTR